MPSIAPIRLNEVTPYSEIDGQKPDAENRRSRARRAPQVSAPQSDSC